MREAKRCLDTSPCTPEKWNSIEEDAAAPGVGMANWVRARRRESAMQETEATREAKTTPQVTATRKRSERLERERSERESRALDYYLRTCGRSELDGAQKSRCRSGLVWNFDVLRAVAERELKAKQLFEVREVFEARGESEVTAAPQVTAPREAREERVALEAGLTREEREEALAASFGVRDFRKLVDDVIEAMANDRGLKEDLGTTRPTLLIAAIENRSGANIDTQLISDSIRIRLTRVRLFAPVNRAQLETLLQEQQLEQSGLGDADTAAQIGRTLGAQYMLYAPRLHRRHTHAPRRRVADCLHLHLDLNRH